MGRYWQGSVKKTEIGQFTCRRCGWQGRAKILAVGVGQDSSDQNEAMEKAHLDVKRDAVRTISRARCRRCGQRAPGAVVTFALPYFLGTLACLWVGMRALPFLGFAVAVPWFGWSQWKAIDRSIEWLRS